MSAHCGWTPPNTPAWPSYDPGQGEGGRKQTMGSQMGERSPLVSSLRVSAAWERHRGVMLVGLQQFPATHNVLFYEDSGL